MNTKAIIAMAWAASIVATAAATYYGTNYYQEYSRYKQIADRTGLSIAEVRERFGQGGAIGGRAFGDAANATGAAGSSSGSGLSGGMMGGGRSVTGKVDAVDDSSITITTPRGSEKIKLDKDTKVSKASDGALADVKAGGNVIIQGTRSSSGDFTAETVLLLK